MTYGEAVNVDDMSAMRYLPEGLVEGCKLKRAISKDQVLTYDDVELPAGRLADRLRAEQYRYFRGEIWLEEHLQSARSRPYWSDTAQSCPSPNVQCPEVNFSEDTNTAEETR